MQRLRNSGSSMMRRRALRRRCRRGGTLAFWFLYLTDKSFRMAMEVEAYRAQIKAGASAYGCAVSLATGYGLNLTTDQAYKELTDE